MRIESKLIAVGLSAAALLAECGNNSISETTFRVGEDHWVQVDEPITEHYNNDINLEEYDDCLIMRGSELILKNENLVDERVVYKTTDESDDATAFECPDGAVIRMTSGALRSQNRSYQSFANHRDEVKRQISEMSDPVSEPVQMSGRRVELVNPEPIEQVSLDSTYNLEYGDSCYAAGKVQKIGQLTTGETVMEVTNQFMDPYHVGMDCPNGAIYLEATN